MDERLAQLRLVGVEGCAAELLVPGDMAETEDVGVGGGRQFEVFAGFDLPR